MIQLHSLRPIDSNLRRVQLACGRKNSLEPNSTAVKQERVEATLAYRLEELQMTLLGMMVSLHGITNHDSLKHALGELRQQISTYRSIYDNIEQMGHFHASDVLPLAKLVLITFYDLEGALRKRVNRPAKADGLSRSTLVAAIAEKSNSAIGLALKKE